MNFEQFRFYHCIPDELGDFNCFRIKEGNFRRLPHSRVMAIHKSWPKFLDFMYLTWHLSPMDVKIIR
jgi:hypothetical protein